MLKVSSALSKFEVPNKISLFLSLWGLTGRQVRPHVSARVKAPLHPCQCFITINSVHCLEHACTDCACNTMQDSLDRLENVVASRLLHLMESEHLEKLLVSICIPQSNRHMHSVFCDSCISKFKQTRHHSLHVRPQSQPARPRPPQQCRYRISPLSTRLIRSVIKALTLQWIACEAGMTLCSWHASKHRDLADYLRLKASTDLTQELPADPHPFSSGMDKSWMGKCRNCRSLSAGLWLLLWLLERFWGKNWSRCRFLMDAVTCILGSLLLCNVNVTDAWMAGQRR